MKSIEYCDGSDAVIICLMCTIMLPC